MISSWHPIASPQLSLMWLKWGPAVLGPLGFTSSFVYDRCQEDEFSLEKKPQLNMLIKALGFFCFLQMCSKNESLSADLKPGQRVLGPSNRVGWLPEPRALCTALSQANARLSLLPLQLVVRHWRVPAEGTLNRIAQFTHDQKEENTLR